MMRMTQLFLLTEKKYYDDDMMKSFQKFVDTLNDKVESLEHEQLLINYANNIVSKVDNDIRK